MTIAGDVFENPLVELTGKQREVLDLLIQHKTSKEISRLLGISPHTVDQRIMLARAKLGVATRGEVAQAYRRLVEAYEQPVYEISHVGFPPLPVASPAREDTVANTAETWSPAQVQQAPRVDAGDHVALQDRVSHPSIRDQQDGYYHVLPEMFDGPNGTLLRLGYIGGVTVFLILIVLGGLSMFAQLSAMLDR